MPATIQEGFGYVNVIDTQCGRNLTQSDYGAGMAWVPVIDVSQHQGAINFATMRSRGVRHVIMRASHGHTQDARLATYYVDALAAGFAPHEISFYSFINPKRGSGPATAQTTAKIIRDVTGGRTAVSYMLDIESYRNEPPNAGTSPVSGPAFSQYIKEHIAAFRAAMPGSYIYAYSNRAYWNSADGPQDAALAALLEWLVPRYPLYSDSAYQSRGYPPVPSQWDEYAFGLAAGPFAPVGAVNWQGWQFSAGYNKQGNKYGCASLDLDLNIVDDQAVARWFSPSAPYVPPTPVPPIQVQEPEVFIPHRPSRLFRSTVSADVPTQVPVAPGTPDAATGVAVNITFTGSLKAGHATIWNGVGDPPEASQINWKATADPSNSFTVVEIVGGKFTVQATDEVNLIFDQVGYTMPPVAGPQGPQGVQGPQGIQGVQGVPGPQGEPGTGTTPEQIIDAVVDELTD